MTEEQKAKRRRERAEELSKIHPQEYTFRKRSGPVTVKKAAAFCAVCGEPADVSQRDVDAGGKRPWFCGLTCFRVYRDAETAKRGDTRRKYPGAFRGKTQRRKRASVKVLV